MSATLVLHCGASRVTREELALVPTPPATATWFPVPHTKVLDETTSRLTEAGYRVTKTDLALTRDGARFFGTLDLDSVLMTGTTLAVGIRNSMDRSFPMSFVGGARTFVCDNMAFRSDLLVKRKHSRHGSLRFANAVSQAVTALSSFKETEAVRLRRMAETEVPTERAESLILRAYLRQLVSFKLLHEIERQWREPECDWGGNTLWKLLNCFTFAMRDVAKKTPNEYANRTMRLNALLCPFGGGSGPGGTPAALPAGSPSSLAA